MRRLPIDMRAIPGFSVMLGGARVERTGDVGSLYRRITYRFEDLGSSVRFTRQAEADTPGLTRLLAPLMQRLLAGRSAVFVENLRRRLEDVAGQ